MDGVLWGRNFYKPLESEVQMDILQDARKLLTVIAQHHDEGR